jgi:RNA polymerase sigma-70 factor (ECF subfamily)
MAGILRDPDIAQEVSQEALLRLILQERAGRSPRNPNAWLSRVAFNLAMSHGRHAQVVRRRASELALGPSHASAEEAVLEQERYALVRRAMAELHAEDRTMLVLAATGHTGVEIASRTGRSHSAVRVRLHRARRQLRTRLQQLEAA